MALHIPCFWHCMWTTKPSFVPVGDTNGGLNTDTPPPRAVSPSLTDINTLIIQTLFWSLCAFRGVRVQEKSETFRVSAETAELHSLLQTGKFERQALQVSIA